MTRDTLRPFVEKIAEKYPSAGNLTIAKMLVRDHPEVFTDVERTRAVVRYWRGSLGAVNRRQVPNPIPSPKFKPGKKRIGGWAPYRVKLPCNALVLSDVHIPYHDDEAIKVALQTGKKEKVDTIILAGDILDCHALSFWMTDPRERKFKEELDQTRGFLCMLREKFPSATIVYKLGNHEERYEHYMISKAPEMLDISEFSLDTLLWLDDLQIDLVDEKRIVKVGDLNIVHGHEWKGGATNPVNPARGLFLRAKSYTMCGHFHQASYHQGKTIDDKVTACWSLGCLCDMHPHYRPFNEWTHGFGLVRADKDGHFEARTPVIKGGKSY